MSGQGDLFAAPEGQVEPAEPHVVDKSFVEAHYASDAVNPHQLLMASAGTGKTFQLANHFAGLLVCGVEPQG